VEFGSRCPADKQVDDGFSGGNTGWQRKRLSFCGFVKQMPLKPTSTPLQPHHDAYVPKSLAQLVVIAGTP
jgi:hypothetical protein